MNATIIQAIVRHLLTTVGGGMLMSFGLTGATLDAVVGAVSTLAGVAWSLAGVSLVMLVVAVWLGTVFGDRALHDDTSAR